MLVRVRTYDTYSDEFVCQNRVGGFGTYQARVGPRILHARGGDRILASEPKLGKKRGKHAS